VVVIATTVSSAFAASVGGATSKALTGITMPAAPGAPTVVAWEAFTGTTGASLAGTTTDGGAKTWSVNPTGGAWTISANKAVSSSANSSLVIDAGSSSDSAVVTIFRNGAMTFDAGLTVNRNSGGTQFMTVEWTSTSNGSLELWTYNGAWTQIGGVTNLYSSIAAAPASITLKLTSSTSNVLTASINGTPTVSATLSAANVTTFKNSTHQLFGLFQWTSNGLTYDDFHLDNP
ncbi:MAG: hypothetical protein ACXV8T_06840, partial [Acidimicrobiia bacterium]